MSNKPTKAILDFNKKTIEIHTRIEGEHIRYKVDKIDTTDQTVIFGLKKLGWTPPEDK